MKFPQIVVCAFDEWVANQLRDLVAEQKWLLREVRQPAATRELLADTRPTVLLIQADPTDASTASLALLADVHRLHPEVGCVVISDTKLAEEERSAWSATALDLGARAVLFPPLTRPVIEDVVSGLLTAAVQRGGAR